MKKFFLALLTIAALSGAVVVINTDAAAALADGSHIKNGRGR